MINQARLRSLLRWAHIVEGAFLGVYIFSPLHADPLWTDIARYVIFPLAGLSGLWMWQQGRIARWMRQYGMAASGPHPAASKRTAG
jgi:hypothetical protein